MSYELTTQKHPPYYSTNKMDIDRDKAYLPKRKGPAHKLRWQYYITLTEQFNATREDMVTILTRMEKHKQDFGLVEN